MLHRLKTLAEAHRSCLGAVWCLLCQLWIFFKKKALRPLYTTHDGFWSAFSPRNWLREPAPRQSNTPYMMRYIVWSSENHISFCWYRECLRSLRLPAHQFLALPDPKSSNTLGNRGLYGPHWTCQKSLLRNRCHAIVQREGSQMPTRRPKQSWESKIDQNRRNPLADCVFNHIHGRDGKTKFST